MMKNKRDIKELLEDKSLIGQQVEVKGWIDTARGSKEVGFIALNDGSCLENLQVVVDKTSFDEACLKELNRGAAIQVKGEIVVSQGSGQASELQASEICILGICDPETYPIQPKKHSFEFLRDNAHLRLRTKTFRAIFRIRHQLSYAIHRFFHKRGYYYMHAPIISSSDAEGAGTMFQVTTLSLENAPKTKEGEVDYSQDFFGVSTNLSVSGQLEAELGALALGRVYTFSPTFRAENSNTKRHLAEFWMIEPEMAFFDIEDNMDLAEELLQEVIKDILKDCESDLIFLEQRQVEEQKNLKADQRSMPLIEKLNFILNAKFARITYTEAIDILRNSKPNKKKKFQFPIDEWGIDLQSEHERYLVEKHFKKPVIVTDYPKTIKAFYMKQNSDGKTVRGMDVLFPQIGEIVGGSQREENYDALLENMKAMDVPHEEMQWYLETRKFGSVVHSGFGLGFERLMMFITGMENIRDVIPFPRTPQNARF